MIGNLISPITSLASTWLEGRVNKAKAETDVKVARAKAEAKVYETEATSSMLMEQNLTQQMARKRINLTSKHKSPSGGLNEAGRRFAKS